MGREGGIGFGIDSFACEKDLMTDNRADPILVVGEWYSVNVCLVAKCDFQTPKASNMEIKQIEHVNGKFFDLRQEVSANPEMMRQKK